MDGEIPSGERWDEVLKDQVAACRALLVVMSPAAARSQWVAKEVQLATELDKEILSLLYEGGVILGLDHLQHEDVTGGVMPSPGFVERLRGYASHRRVVAHMVGLVPEAADCFQHRLVADFIDTALAAGGTAILTGGGSAQILSGLGGVGKTQLAASVARRLRDSGGVDVLVWASATDQTAIVTSFASAGAEIWGVDPSNPRE